MASRIALTCMLASALFVSACQPAEVDSVPANAPVRTGPQLAPAEFIDPEAPLLAEANQREPRVLGMRSTWDPPEAGYIDNATYLDADPLAFGASLNTAIAVVEVLTVGDMRWNSEDGEWWVHNPHSAEDPPTLLREVTVEVVAVPPTRSHGLAVGDQITVVVYGGFVRLVLTDDELDDLAAYQTVGTDHTHGDEPDYEPAQELVWNRVPSMRLTEGDKTLVFLLPSSDSQADSWVGALGPDYSNWQFQLGGVSSGVTGERVALGELAQRLSEGGMTQDEVGLIVEVARSIGQQANDN